MKMRQRRKARQRAYPKWQPGYIKFHRYQQSILNALSRGLGISMRTLTTTTFSAAREVLVRENEWWRNLREPISDAEFRCVMLGIPYDVIRPNLPIDQPKD